MFFKTHILNYFPIQSPLQTTTQKINWSGYKLGNIWGNYASIHLYRRSIACIYLFI